MFLDAAGNPQTMPYQDIQISSGVPPSSLSYWKIVDENGYQYFFGETSSQREEITYSTGNNTQGYTEKYTYISSWYLNKIISPSGIEVATFTYFTGSDFEYLMYHDMGTKPQSGSLSVKRVNTKVKVKQAKYINTITTSIGKVQFGYINNRLDVPNSWQLNFISYLDQFNIVKRKFHLILDYFMGEFSTPNDRLRLREVKEGISNPVLLYSFQYNEITGGSFIMNPFRNNYRFDHYGYYNLGSIFCTPNHAIDVGCAEYGVTKSPSGDISYTAVFSLQEIKSATGGRTVFEYETVGSGLRIKSISNFSGSSLIAKSSFTYSGGQSPGTTRWSPEVPVYSFTASDGTEVWSSSSFKDIFDLGGVVIGYSTATETFLDGSKIVREFTNFSDLDYNDTPPLVEKYSGPPLSPSFVSNANVNGPPFAPGTSAFWKRGNPKSIKIYDSQNNLLKKDTMIYEESDQISTVQNRALHRHQQTGGTNPQITYLSGVYSLISKVFRLKETRTYTYDQNGYLSNIQEKSVVDYHPVHKTFPSSITRQVGNGPEEKVTYRYPTDVAGTGSQNPGPQPLAEGIRTLVQQKIITPIEQVSWFKDYGESSFKITSASLIAFHKNTTLGTPALNSVYSLVIDAPIQSLNPEASLTSNKTVFSFDNRYRLLENYTYNEPTATLSTVQKSDGLTSLLQWLNNTLISSVTVNPGTNQQKTEYQYNSIYGLTQSKDMNDRLTKYEFDNQYGQLLRIRDNENNIIERYRHHYKNQPEQLSNSSIFNYGCRMVGIETTLSSPENTSYGQTTYHWDFGDGTSTSTTNSRVGKVYQSAGSYTVKVRKENPEYYSLETSTVVTIFNQASNLTIIPNGETSIDNCSDIWWGYATELQASATGDVQSFSWEYQAPGSSWWWSLGSGPVVYTPPGFYHGGITGTYLVKCTMTNYCGNTFDEYIYLFVYASDPFCPQY